MSNGQGVFPFNITSLRLSQIDLPCEQIELGKSVFLL